METMSNISLCCKNGDKRCSKMLDCLGQLHYHGTKCVNCIWYLFNIDELSGERSRMESIFLSEYFKQSSEYYEDVRSHLEYYKSYTNKWLSPICRYKCINCRNKYIFNNCNEIYIKYNHKAKSNYYIICIRNVCNGKLIEVPINRRTKYNEGLENYIRSIIRTRISKFDINLHYMFILHLKILYNFGHLPRELALAIMLQLIY